MIERDGNERKRRLHGGLSLLVKAFLYSAGLILFVSGLAKLISATGSDGYLRTKDPIIGIQFSHILVVAGIVECLAAMLCFLGKDAGVKVLCVGWLSTNFLIYRIGLVLIGYHRPCHCLGNLTTAIHVSPNVADLVMKCILAYLLAGSYATLFWLWRQRKKTYASALPQ